MTVDIADIIQYKQQDNKTKVIHVEQNHQEEGGEYLNMIDDEADAVSGVYYGAMMTDDGWESSDTSKHIAPYYIKW